MPAVVVPFRAENAKQRLAPAPDDVREAVARSMLDDVLAACEALGPTYVAGGEEGQGEAVSAALREIDERPILVVNADLPAVRPRDVTVIGNVGDDLEVASLHISPDLDTILYTLAGVLDEERGWGRAEESWNAHSTAGELGAENWFQLGDRDLGLHLARTEALRRGEPLSALTARLAGALGVDTTLLPATD